jgi:tRNA/tmRNA/rRNA uracil-C5-methylase (TrmA/RlmC/RlmD family)
MIVTAWPLLGIERQQNLLIKRAGKKKFRLQRRPIAPKDLIRLTDPCHFGNPVPYRLVCRSDCAKICFNHNWSGDEGSLRWSANDSQDVFRVTYRMSTPASPSDRLPESFSLRIDEVAFGGAGVGRQQGKVVFVPFTIDGEIILARLVKDHRNHAEAEMDTLLQPSAQRREPPCQYFSSCGGCDYQHIAYEHQLTIKERQVRHALRRLAGLTEPEVKSIVPSPKEFGYRNRVTVHEDEQALGFFARQSRHVIDIVSCPIASPAVNQLLQKLRATRTPGPKHRTLREHSDQITFQQTNDLVAERLRNYVVAQASGEVVMDAFCGQGFFAHALAERFSQVVGIEWSLPAVKRAQSQARSNEVYLSGDVARILPDALARFNPDTLVLDPSREGLSREILEIILERPAERVVYVSCNTPALARDLKTLTQAYTAREVQPFDMFPQTAEIEVVAVLQRAR